MDTETHAGGHGSHMPESSATHTSEDQGHDRHAGHSTTMFRDRFWVCLGLTLPVVAYSPMVWEWLGATAPELPGPKVVPFALATVIFIYGGQVFFRSAAGELRVGTPAMMTLVSLGIGTAYAYSVATTFVLEGEGFYWEMATLVDVMLLGHWIEMRSIGRAQGALAELAKLLPDTAERVSGGGTEEVPVSTLQTDDIVVVRPGGRVPADGEIVEGESHLDESMLTGESKPVARRVGDSLVAGAVNQEGSLRIRVTATGDATALAGIGRLVREAQAAKSRAQAIADRAATVLTYVAIASGVITALAWIVLTDRGAAFIIERTVTVIVIACPHALGLAVPLVITISTSLAARNGLLVRDRLALEQAKDLKVVVFDKTGTLTKGQLGLAAIATAEDWNEDRALGVAAALEGDSEHPLGRAIVAEAERRGIRSPTVQAFKALAGRGVKGQIDGEEMLLGGPRLIEETNASSSGQVARFMKERAANGNTVISLIAAGRVVASFALADVIRDESREAVRSLHDLGMRVAMITGDSEEVARAVAASLEIDEFFAQVLPEDKAARIRELQERGDRVAMVGDGVNDAPALAQADVGIAIGAGTDVAIESADVILVRDDPRDVVRVVGLSQATYRKMVQNLVWATGYNVFAIPLAAGILAPIGFVLAPAIGALLMSVSTVVVALNAQLLRRRSTLA
ncbi:MAG: heavy metal translocating P-type ATPase [Actinomycetota bacterium]